METARTLMIVVLALGTLVLVLPLGVLARVAYEDFRDGDWALACMGSALLLFGLVGMGGLWWLTVWPPA